MSLKSRSSQQVSYYIKVPASSEKKVADIWFVDETTKFEQLLKGFYFLRTQFRIHTARGQVKKNKSQSTGYFGK